MSVTNDNMEQLRRDVDLFIQAWYDGDQDGKIRYGQHLIKKLMLLVDNTVKQQRMQKLRPMPTHIGQLHNRAKAPLRHRTVPITDKKWADGNLTEPEAPEYKVQEEVQQQTLTPEQAADLRRRLGLPDEIETTYQDYTHNDSPEKRKARIE
jgi:hypothetical protein